MNGKGRKFGAKISVGSAKICEKSGSKRAIIEKNDKKCSSVFVKNRKKNAAKNAADAKKTLLILEIFAKSVDYDQQKLVKIAKTDGAAAKKRCWRKKRCWLKALYIKASRVFSSVFINFYKVGMKN